MKKYNKTLLVRQLDITDCGAACLSSILKFYGKNRTVSAIRLDAGTGKDGTSMLGLIRAAEKQGLEADAVRVNDKKIDKADLPVIAHMKIRNSWYHFVVIYDIDDKGYLLMDPAKNKLIRTKHEKFINEWTGILLLLKVSKEFRKGKKDYSDGSKVLKIIAPFKKSLIIAFAGAIIYSVMGIATAIYIKFLTDKLIPSGELRLLNAFSLIIILIIILRVIAGYLKNLIILKTGQKIDKKLINNYNRHLLELPLNFFQSMKTGELLTRINDAIKIRNFINSIAQDISVNFLIVIITLSIMMSYSIKLGSVLLISAPIYALIFKILNTANRKYLKAAMEQSADMESSLVETIKGMSTIKAFLREPVFNKMLRQKSGLLLETVFQASRIYALSSHAAELISSTWLIFILWAGSREIISGTMSYGELFSFYSLYAYLSAPLISLILSNRGYQDAKIATKRLFQVMDLDKEVNLSDERSSREIKETTLSVEELSFGYPGKLKLLEDISFCCQPGSITAIAGASGEGKSTILSLLMRFYEPDKGRILLNNRDSLDIGLFELRQNIAWVPQSVSLFSGTLADNISMDKNDQDQEKIKQSILISGLKNLVDRLPNDIYTMITEDGNNFSGGEKQKIALARAVHKDSCLLLLDEPSSNMDIQSEQELIEVLKGLKDQGKTIIIASHKLSLVSFADQILILEKGKLIESGTHSLLMESNGIYRKIWDIQNKFSYKNHAV